MIDGSVHGETTTSGGCGPGWRDHHKWWVWYRLEKSSQVVGVVQAGERSQVVGVVQAGERSHVMGVVQAGERSQVMGVVQAGD